MDLPCQQSSLSSYPYSTLTIIKSQIVACLRSTGLPQVDAIVSYSVAHIVPFHGLVNPCEALIFFLRLLRKTGLATADDSSGLLLHSASGVDAPSFALL